MLYLVHMPNQQQTHMTVREAAEALGKDVSTVGRMIRAGELHATKAFDGLRAPYLLDRVEVLALAAKRGAA